MAVVPTTLIDGYASDGTNITLPIADLPGLTVAEANAATGDGREIVRAILDNVLASYTALATKPTKFTITSPPMTLAPGGGTRGVLRKSYTLTFDLEPQGFEMDSEPT